MATVNALDVVPLYEGMAAYAAAYRAAKATGDLGAEQQAALWQEHVLAPYWDRWAGGQFNEERVREQMAAPIADVDGLAREAAILATVDLAPRLEQTYARITATLPSPEPGRAVAVAALDPANDYVRREMQGVVGQCVGDNILLQVAAVPGWDVWLPYNLAHEYHHAIWGYTYFFLQGHTGLDLLAMIISEGMADSFAHSVFPELRAPWTRALTPEQEAAQWQAMQPLLESEDPALYERFMFGNGETPGLTGYTIGYGIVQRFLQARPELAPADWVAVDPHEMLAASGYDGGAGSRCP